MSPPTDPATSAGDVITGAAGWLTALGVVTMVLFPFALPGIVLTVALVAPVLVLGLAAGLVGAVVAAPVLVVRRLRRSA